jgi:outer membrane translocation and assembly module TamA
MHKLVRFLVVFFLASAAFGQSRPPESASNVRISKLVIDSSGLPAVDRKQLIQRFQQKTYPQPEIGERIRQALQDMGYFKADVVGPRFSSLKHVNEKGTVDVFVTVEPGTQYRLGEIRFEKATVFPTAQLRGLFALRNGEPFSRTVFVKGLESMRKLYETMGYVNFVATPVPIFEESRRTIDMVITIGEGKPFNFGQLYLEGIEPHAGAAKELTNSWKPLVGKRYNSLELQQWLLAHHADWKVGPDSMKLVMGPDYPVVNIKLTQWPN